MKTFFAMSLLLLLLSSCGPEREQIYESTYGDMNLKAYADTPSPLMYATSKYLVLGFKGRPGIYPQWGYVGQELPYRADVYGTAPVYYFDTTVTTMRLRPDMEPWSRQLRMLYLSRKLYSAAEFESIHKLLAHELPKLDSVLLHHPDETIRKMSQYKIVGMAYGRIDDFTQVYTDGEESLSILPDGTAQGSETSTAIVSGFVGSNRYANVEIRIADTASVDIPLLSNLRSTKTNRRLRDDFPIVIEQYDPKTSTFLPRVMWSVPSL